MPTEILGQKEGERTPLAVPAVKVPWTHREASASPRVQPPPGCRAGGIVSLVQCSRFLPPDHVDKLRLHPDEAKGRLPAAAPQSWGGNPVQCLLSRTRVFRARTQVGSARSITMNGDCSLSNFTKTSQQRAVNISILSISFVWEWLLFIYDPGSPHFSFTRFNRL